MGMLWVLHTHGKGYSLLLWLHPNLDDGKVGGKVVTGMRRPSSSMFKYKLPKYQRLRKAIFERDNFTCRHCGWRPSVIPEDYTGRYSLGERVTVKRRQVLRCLELDHIIPASRGGSNESENLQTLCNACNCKKFDHMPESSAGA